MAFQPTIQTSTTDNSLPKDASFPALGALDAKNMPGANALAGPLPGVDVKLIHNGDLSELLDKNRQTKITLSDIRHIKQALDETVDQAVTLKYNNGRTLTVYVFDTTEVHGDRSMTVTGHDKEDYTIHREVSEPVEFETKGLEMGFKGMSIDTKGLSVEGTALTIGVEGLKVVSGLFHESNELIESQLRNLFGLTKTIDYKVGLLALHLDPRVNGGPTVSTSAPFGA